MLGAADWIVVIAYFAAVFGVAIWASRQRREDTADYFLAGRHAGWVVIGASLFASNIGSEHLVGLSGSGAATGLAVAQFEIIASLMLLLLGWVFVPVYLRTGVFTMPEFLERRYSAAARWYLAVISIVSYVLTKISVTIAAGGIVFEALMGIDFWTGAFVVVLATGAYTIFGGLRAVLYTDVLQAAVLVVGAAAVTGLGLVEVGGWEAVTRTVEPEMLSVWRSVTDPDFPWTGILFGAPILGLWYWCTDQFIVQRVLSARGLDHARGGTIFAGFLKLLPLFIFVLPGVIAAVLGSQGKLTLGDPDEALPTLIGTLLPVGLRGLVVAGLLAALMSSLSSVFNSCSTLITIDCVKKLRPQTSERGLVLIGQVATAGLVVLGLAWIPVIQSISGQLYQYLQSVQAYISPPVAACFLLGIVWPGAHNRGALLCLGTGFVLGAARLILEINQQALVEGSWLHGFATVNFLHFAVLLFLICTGCLIVGSWGADGRAGWRAIGAPRLVGGTPAANVTRLASVLLGLAVGAIWWCFA